MTCTQHTALPPALFAVAVLLLTAAFGAGTAQADFDFTFETEQAIKVGPVGFDYVKVHCVVTNTGTDPDAYDIAKDQSETPVAWDVSICVGGEDGTCYAPFVNLVEDEIPLNPGESDTVSIYFTPLDGEGSGYATLTVTSVGNAAVEHALTLGCVTEGCDVVIVDDDGGDTYETYYESAMLITHDYGTWRRELAHVGDYVAGIPAMIWFTGDATSTLDAVDRDDLEGYMANGGRLFLTGQEIAYDLCDPGSPNWSLESQAWYESWTNATYVQNSSGTTTLDPVAGEGINGGMTLTIEGGDGANNQTSPDVLAPAPGGFAVWDYTGGAGVGAIRVEGVIYRAVVFGFGFEGICCENDRQMVMFNVLDYLDDPLIGIGDQGTGAVPTTLVLDDPRPNPFNPDVSIRYSVPAAGEVELRVVDVNGRLIDTLVDGFKTEGAHRASWDGRNANGRRMPSGVYFFELRAGDLKETSKAVLAK